MTTGPAPDTEDPVEIVHRDAAGMFESLVQGQRAHLDYHVDGNVMVITHTFVPPVARGLGLAEKLTVAALQYAGERSLVVDPRCSYVHAWLQRNDPDGVDWLR